METKAVLDRLLDSKSIAIDGKAFEADQIEHLQLDTGEKLYWFHCDENLWLSLDIASEGMMLFQDIDEGLSDEEETVVYGGVDYEFTYEASCKVVDEEGEELDRLTFREYEAGDGMIRMIRYEVSGEFIVSSGTQVVEDAVHPI